MSVAVTHVLRQRPVLKTVSALVLAAFLSLSLQPLAVAAQALQSKPASAPHVSTPGDGTALARTLDTVQNRLNGLERKIGRGERHGEELLALRTLRRDLTDEDRATLKSFEAIGAQLKAKRLPPVILDRHAQAVKTYQAEFARTLQHLDGIDSATDYATRQARTKAVMQFLAEKQRKVARQPIDPNKLPQRILKPNRTNKPRMTPQEFRAAGLQSNPTVKLAALGDFKFDQLPGASDPAYLAETPEVRLTQAIQAKAQELNYEPVKIFNWVYGNTEWVPTWGAIQNADTTLLSQRGNAFDLASLLISLLRASGIPARYVHGTIDVPADRFMNWAGGFSDANGAWDLASASGLPIVGVTSGGQVKSFRVEHIWVEAAIDFAPSRGAVNRNADTWVVLDPSFKQYTIERGHDMYAMLGFNGDKFMTDYFADTADRTPYQYYSGLVISALDAQNPDWTLAELYGHERVSPLKDVLGGNLSLLAASLPYKVMTRGYTAAQIPDSLRHKATIEIANNPAYGSDFTYTISLPELGTDRLTLSYIPESSADDAVVDDYGSLYSAPAYLVRVRPLLKKAGVVVGGGNGAGLGEKQTLLVYLSAPTLSPVTISKKVTAGSYNAIVIQGQKSSRGLPSVNMQQLMTNAGLNEQNQATFDDLLGQLLHNLGINWFFNWVYERDFYATTLQMAYTALPSQAFVTADVTVSYLFGIPRTAQIGLFNIDAHRDVLALGSLTGDSKRYRDFGILTGMTGSSWEHLIFENMFDVPGGSAVKLLKLAAQQGIPVYKINTSNAAQILPLLTLPAEDLADITNAVNAGLDVTVSKSTVNLNNFNGAGYIVLDPVTGAGPYYISGGLAGGVAFTLDEWKKQVYNRWFITKYARNEIVGWANALRYTPYSLGCKDPISFPIGGKDNKGEVYCDPNTKNRKRQSGGLDCSGLVAFAYEIVGFRHFLGKSAQGQYDLVMSEFSSTSNPKKGDLIFFENTFDKNGNGNLTDDGITHVGIISGDDSSEKWIAAEFIQVDYYCSPNYKKLHPTDDCVETQHWDEFYNYGSVLGE